MSYLNDAPIEVLLKDDIVWKNLRFLDIKHNVILIGKCWEVVSWNLERWTSKMVFRLETWVKALTFLVRMNTCCIILSLNGVLAINKIVLTSLLKINKLIGVWFLTIWSLVWFILLWILLFTRLNLSYNLINLRIFSESLVLHIICKIIDESICDTHDLCVKGSITSYELFALLLVLFLSSHLKVF